MKLRVWQVLRQYLQVSENWIYTTISRIQEFDVAVASLMRLVNLEAFPPGRMDVRSAWSFGTDLRELPERWKNGSIGRDYFGRVRLQACEQLMRENPPALLHAHFGPTGYAALALKRRLGVPLITTFYGYDTNPSPSDRMWIDRRAELFQQGDFFLVEGEFMRKTLIELGCPAERIGVQRIAVDTERLRPPIRRKENREPVILLAARFVEKKGLIYALQAVDILKRKGTRFECKVIGSGYLERALRRLVSERGLGSVVSFLGSVNHEAYLRALADAEIFVQPSIMARDGDREGGAPTTILEAQAYEIPVVATFHADIPNVVLDGVSASLVPERDEEALAEAMAALLGDSERRAEMGAAGRRFVVANHSAQVLVPGLEAVYGRVASDPMRVQGTQSRGNSA